MITIRNVTRGLVLADKGRIARSFLSRLMGLMFRTGMEKGEALVFYRAGSIHMFFMRFSIDVVFLDRSMKVIRVVRGLGPWRMANCFGAYCTIEMPGNSTDQLLSVGDTLEIFPDKNE